MKRSTVLLIGLATLVVAGCGGGGSGSAPASAEPRTLTVFAAASLTESFNQIGKLFETENPGVTVKFNYGASSDLAQQIVNGGPADVFAAASPASMKTVSDPGLTSAPPVVFATNELEIATQPGNPKGIQAFADLADPALKVVVCAPQVPCGAATVKVEQATGVDIQPVSEEPDVKSTLGKVTSGNADAGLVYVTDVVAAGNTVTGVNFPEAKQALNDYPIATIKNAPQLELGQRFVQLVQGEQGKKILQAQGFVTP
jgi:molybdate transport system substrate-binding protein